MVKSSYIFTWIILTIVAFIGTVIIMPFKCLGKALLYIGGGLFFLYMLIIALPILILTSWEQFLENPKKFIKQMVIETTQGMMEN